MNTTPLTPTSQCILCDKQAKRVYEGMSGYVKGTSYDVYECAGCLSSFVDPMSNLQEEYDVIYGKESTKDAGYKYYYYLAKGIKKLRKPLDILSGYTAIYWGVLQGLRSLHPVRQLSVLEVGSGLGYFTYALRKAGYHAHGVEYSRTATEFATKSFGDFYTEGTIEAYALDHAGEYDAVVATEVIEHVENPVRFIEAFLQVLKPGGKIIITTPNKDVHPRGTIWETDHAPKHLWWFTEKGLKSIADHFGKKFEAVDFSEYKKHNRYSIPRGIAFEDPQKLPLLDEHGKNLQKTAFSYKHVLMSMLPPSYYLKLVKFYHTLLLSKNKNKKEEDGSMYILCAIITK